MKTLLIPIDFSNTSANVIRYVSGFVKDVPVQRVLLLKSYYVSLYAQLLPSADFVQLNAADIMRERGRIEKKLRDIASKLLKDTDGKLKVEIAVSELPLLRAIHELTEQESPDLLITGSDHSPQHSSPAGELVISIARTSSVPVMVIPARVRYQPVIHALVPCDFGAISRLSLLKRLNRSENWLKPELLILNVDPKQESAAPQKAYLHALEKMLDGYNYTIHHSKDRDKVNAILGFSRQHNVQLIIALPGRYSFFYNLTHSSITEALALNAGQPVLILK